MVKIEPYDEYNERMNEYRRMQGKGEYGRLDKVT